MLTHESIIKATRQMASFGEKGTAGALDHLPSRVMGPIEKKKSGSSRTQKSSDVIEPARIWDDELKIFVQA